MLGNILGISDSRPPGSRLSAKEAKELFLDLGVKHHDTEGCYGCLGQYIFYRDGPLFVKHYAAAYSECVHQSALVHQELAQLELAPPLHDVHQDEKKITTISEYCMPLSEVSTLASSNVHDVLCNAVAQLHSAMAIILETNPNLKLKVREETKKMLNLITIQSQKLVCKYNLKEGVYEDFLAIIEIIKKEDNIGHGDMHPGNIVVSDQRVKFIDFESVFHSRGAAMCDYVNLARFLPGIINKKEFLADYAVSVAAATNYLLVKNSCVINYLQGEGKYVSKRECEKFFQKILK